MHHLMIMVSPVASGSAEEVPRLAVIATLSKGYDLDYIWKQVDPSLAKDAAGYYIQASETGGEPPGRWWGPGAKALGLEPRPAGRAGTVRPAVRRAQGPRRHPAGQAAGQRQEGRRHLRPARWPPSRTPPPSASASCGWRPPARPGRARCSST